MSIVSKNGAIEFSIEQVKDDLTEALIHWAYEAVDMLDGFAYNTVDNPSEQDKLIIDVRDRILDFVEKSHSAYDETIREALDASVDAESVYPSALLETVDPSEVVPGDLGDWFAAIPRPIRNSEE